MEFSVLEIDEEDDGLFMREVYVLIVTDSSGKSKEFIELFSCKETAVKIAEEFQKYIPDDVNNLGDAWI